MGVVVEAIITPVWNSYLHVPEYLDHNTPKTKTISYICGFPPSLSFIIFQMLIWKKIFYGYPYKVSLPQLVIIPPLAGSFFSMAGSLSSMAGEPVCK